MPEDSDEHERFMRLFLANELAIMRAVLVFVPQRADARDIVQEVAVALWRHFHRYDANRPFINWAYGFARIEVQRFLRARQQRTALTLRAAEALEASDAAHAARFAERERHLSECREVLPPTHRALIDGYYLEEASIETLASRHNRSIEATYKMLQRIRNALLECIERKTAEAGA